MRPAPFRNYLQLGGLPGIYHLSGDKEMTFQVLEGIYHTVILHDVVERFQIRNISLLKNTK